MSRNPSASPFTVIAHRGGSGHAPENTLLALDTGIKMGAHWLECDVQLHEGALLLMHDLRLERTTNGKGRLADLPLAELRRLDAGKGQQIPTLEEVLDLVDQRAGMNIELKTWNGTAAAVAKVLREYVAQGWPLDKLMVSSFHLPELYEFRQIAPEIPIGVLLCGVPLDWAGCAVELGAVSLNVSDEFLDERLLADAHARGLKVYVYTVNHPEEIARMKAMGVDGIFTNYPERALG